ncbi:MarR family winged helix-turn-helix transcriptional regulator [Winogradskyella tangerina]|uniref:MarR family winged helix-turn-helix transcriptional regulator n=1 Tax=Winogradskyella tangerina TaxID=2023240 RepID=UPI000DBE4293|nr:MarR family winged helix-turn-helix transcriptional regulator [Winogradskyella tangerina]
MEIQETKYCTCLYHSANAFARVMTKMADEAFAPTGLSTSYAFLLMTVNDSPGIQPKAISCQMQLTPSTVTRLIEKMEYRGLLERKSVGRATQVFPTEKSEALKPELKKAWQSLYKQYTSILGKETARKLTDDIHKAYMEIDK